MSPRYRHYWPFAIHVRQSWDQEVENMTYRRWLLLVALVAYLAVGLAWGLWEQASADLNDPSPQPVWSLSLAPDQRVRAMVWLAVDVVLWPLFVPMGAFQCWLLGRCG